jgi:hypothetical protein
MAKRLDKQDIVSLNIVRPYHVSQSVDAFTGIVAYDINVSGSFQVTGSTILSGSTYIKTLTDTAQTNILTINPTTGQLFYTASSAVGTTTNTGFQHLFQYRVVGPHSTLFTGECVNIYKCIYIA